MLKIVAVFTQKMSITWRLILYFSLILLVQMIFIGVFSNSWLSNYLENANINRMQQINSSVLHEINYFRNNYEEMSDIILASNYVQILLKKTYDVLPDTQMLDDKSTLEKVLYDPTNMTNTVIIGENGIVYQSCKDVLMPIIFSRIRNTIVYKKSLTSKGNNIWVPSKENILNNNTEPSLYICRTLNSLDIKNTKLGQLMIQIPFDEVNAVFNQNTMEEGEYFAITDNDGVYIYNTKYKNKIGEKADESILPTVSNQTNEYKIVNKGKVNYLVVYSKYQGNGWNIIHVLPMSVITSNAGMVRNYILLIMLLSLLLLLPILIILSSTISKPIQKLKSTVELFGEGNLSTRSEVKRMDEIGRLQFSFNKMAEDINDLLCKNAEKNKQLRIMELNMIEYQINPHFLYNSLDTINWIAQKQGNKDIEEMAVALANFFRIGLSNGKEFIKIKDELEHVKQYLLINKIRFKDSFRFEVQAEQDILDCLTIKIILQPIVENAIKYAIDKNASDGCIRVIAKREKSDIIFEVTDNGPGIEKDRISAISNALEKHIQIDENSANGFGLFNVNKRIWMHYGDGYGITINSRIGIGTVVYIKIPLSH
ncbi:MAG TPA: histidine kinase [Ruminiclostridium sp.]